MNVFTSLIEKYTPWQNYTVALPIKSHTDYHLFQELAARHPSQAEMEQVFLAFWNQQDKDKKYFWRDANTFKLNTYCRHYDVKRAAISANANESHEKGLASGMTCDIADELLKEALATTQAHGYDVQAETVEVNGVWLVKVLWEGKIIMIESVSHWYEVFETMQDMIEESQKLQLA